MAIAIDRTDTKQFPGHGGFGQVEPNHLSAPRDGGVYAQLPAAAAIKVLENGMFVKYDMVKGEVNFTSENGPWMLVFNEEKLYSSSHQMHRDFAQKVEDSSDGKIYPRVFRLSVGDIYTTNCVKTASYTKGKLLKPGTDGLLAEASAAGTGLTLQVVAETTLPDGTNAIKVQVVQE